MFILQMNPVTGRMEDMVAVAHSETKEELCNFLEQERTDLYKDTNDGFYKVYKKGSRLEMMNPPVSVEEVIIDVGTREEWANRAMQNFDKLVSTTFKV